MALGLLGSRAFRSSAGKVSGVLNNASRPAVRAGRASSTGRFGVRPGPTSSFSIPGARSVSGALNSSMGSRAVRQGRASTRPGLRVPGAINASGTLNRSMGSMPIRQGRASAYPRPKPRSTRPRANPGRSRQELGGNGPATARKMISFRKGLAMGAGGVVAGAAFSDRSGRPVNKTNYADSRGIYGY